VTIAAESNRGLAEETPRKDTIGLIVGLTLFLATLLNGAATYGKRVGIVDGAAYERFWTQRCGPDGQKPLWLGLGRQCVSRRDPRSQSLASLAAYTVAVRGHDWLLKAAKDLVIAMMIVAGILWAWQSPRWFSTDLWLPMVLATVVGIGALAGLAAGDVSRVAAGLRSFTFLAIALLWIPTASPQRLSGIAFWGVPLLVSQCALVPLELLYGVTERPLGVLRASGTLVHPNTLGVVAVGVLAFGLTFLSSARWIATLWVAATVLVACARSGVGWAVLILLAALGLGDRLRLSPSVKRTLAVGLPVLAVSVMTALTGRPDVLLSVFGRWRTLQNALGEESSSVVLGRGLGVGSNASLTYGGPAMRPSDSMISVLLIQGGLIYLILFYAVLLRALRRSPRSEFLVAMLICSLGADVIEMFPVNALLGLGLAFSLRRPQNVAGVE